MQSQRCPEVWGGVWSSSEWTGGMSEPREAPRMSCRQVVSHTFGLRLWCSAAQPTTPTPHPREMMCWWEVLAVILPTRSLSSWPQEATVAAKHRAGEAETPPGAVASQRASEKGSERVSRTVVSDSSKPHGLWPARLLCPWAFPGRNTGVGSHFLPHRIFPTHGLNLRLLHCRQIQGRPPCAADGI